MSRVARYASMTALVALAAGVACSDERSEVTAPDAGTAYGFQLAGDGRNVPSIALLYRRPSGTAQTPPVDSSLTITLRGLDSLTSRVYQVWLADVADDSSGLVNVVRATGLVSAVRTDSTVNAEGDIVATTDSQVVAASASSFTNGGPATRVVLQVTRATSGANVFDKDVVLVTLEESATATEPGPVRPLWARLASRGAETDEVRVTPSGAQVIARRSTAAGRFGNFAVRPADEYRFVAVGRGRVDILGGILTVADSALARPPVGYYYAASVVARDSTTGTPMDTLDLGAQTAPYPRRAVSLREADVSRPDPVVQDAPPFIIAAASRVLADTVARLSSRERPYRDFAEVRITLESKYGRPDVIAPTVAVSGTVPGVIRYGLR